MHANTFGQSGRDLPAGLSLAPGALGKSTSRLGFGTGGLLRIASARRRQSTLDAALINGITHFDTAPIYGFGESERALGRFARGRRHRVTLTTKFGLRPSAFAARLSIAQSAARRALELFPRLRRVAVKNAASFRSTLYTPPCFDPKTVQAGLEASLRSLRTDYVDFYLAHQASPETPLGDDLIELLERLRLAGKILTYGVATTFEWLGPVLERCPQLSQVAQFDSDVSQGEAAGMLARPGRLLITFGSLQRSISMCRQRLAVTHPAQTRTHRALARMDDETLGAMLLRAQMIANPDGIVLMQSRSIARIERNVRAAISGMNDELIRAMVSLFGRSE